MSTREITSRNDQYTLWQILWIWLSVGAPMWLLGWVVYPAMSAGLTQVDAGLLRLKLLTVGLAWQFVLAMIILYREEGNIQLGTIRRRFWLNHPVSPKTGETKKALWWWIIPFILVIAFLDMGLNSILQDLWVGLFPFFAEPQGYDAMALFAPEVRAQWVGDWGLLGLSIVSALFNTILGEEFIFRGVLLPRMNGVFGKWDWVANGTLFGLYHLHQPWGVLSNIIYGWIVAFSGKRFQSNWFPIILHSTQGVFIVVMVSALVLGLM